MGKGTGAEFVHPVIYTHVAPTLGGDLQQEEGSGADFSSEYL